MKKIFALPTIVVIFSLTFLPSVSNAFSVRSGPEVKVSTEEIIEDNLYLLGGRVDFDKTFDEDIVSVSGNSKISGVVFGDLLNISGDTILDGEFFGDTRVAGGEVTISGNTNKDLVVVARKVTITEDAILNGKTMLVAGEVDFRGEALSDVKIIAGKVSLNGKILSDIEVTTQDIHIGPQAEFIGQLSYFSPEKASIDSGANIQKTPVYNQTESIGDNDIIKRAVLNFISFWTIVKFLATLFTAFILIFVFRKLSQRVAVNSTKHPFKSLSIGVLSLILAPIFAIVLFASLFALPLSIMILLAYFITLLLVPAASGIIVGYWINQISHKKQKVEVDFNSTTLGIILLTFLFFIPILGSILKIVLLPLSFGALVIYYFENLTFKKGK
jgi:cytoskeletal protein CcmA (bactofilin family)